MVVLTNLYQPERMTDVFFGKTVPVRVKGKKLFCDRTFPPHGPYNSTWTSGGGRHQGVNLDFQRHVMNCESSRNLLTGKCDVISGKNVGCGRPVSRKDNSSHSVIKPGINYPESVMSS
jgi:hypothetical protein